MTPETAAAIFDFESLVPRAVASVLTDAGLTVLTIENAVKFQKVRPRVEVIYKHLGEATPKRLTPLPNRSIRTSCFHGELMLHCITDADPIGKMAHSQYRAVVRAVISGLEEAVNGEKLVFHRINFVVTGNEVTGIRPHDGYQETRFPFQIDISIQNDAWATLF
jgi:hypothetical protein